MKKRVMMIKKFNLNEKDSTYSYGYNQFNREKDVSNVKHTKFRSPYPYYRLKKLIIDA